MSHQDCKVRFNVVCLKQALGRLLSGVDWSAIRFRDDCTWTPRMLVWAALLWAWSDERTLVERFASVRKIIQFLFSRQDDLAASYQAFTKMLRRWTPRLIALLQVVLRHRLREVLPGCWEVEGWLMFGVDGSRVELPRTGSHEAVYSPARRRDKSSKRRRGSKRRRQQRRDRAHAKKANSPQMWITTMWHAGTQLPWDWRTGPADSSERAHLKEMLGDLPAGALVAADAGFVGYQYVQAIVDGGRHLLLRVGANVRLLRKLGLVRESAGTVYLWPDHQAKKNRPPLVLRLVVVHTGRHPMYLLTSVPASRMSDAQVARLYARRGGIEVFYRSLKQTFQRRKLRSASAENAHLELEWSLAGLWAMALYARMEVQQALTSPAKLSIAKTLRAFRRMLRDWRHPSEPRRRLCDRLRQAVVDSYQRRDKTSRDYPRQKQEAPPGAPKLQQASKQQIQQAKALQQAAQLKGLTA